MDSHPGGELAREIDMDALHASIARRTWSRRNSASARWRGAGAGPR